MALGDTKLVFLSAVSKQPKYPIWESASSNSPQGNGKVFGKFTSLQWHSSVTVATTDVCGACPGRWPSLPQHLSRQTWPSPPLELLHMGWEIVLDKKDRAQFTTGAANGMWLRQWMTSGQVNDLGKGKLKRYKEYPWEKGPRLCKVYSKMNGFCL